MKDSQASYHELQRVQRLIDNIIDLSIALDDVLAERAKLAAMLHEAQTELAELVERMPARTAA